MGEQPTGMRVIDVIGLGDDAVIVDMEPRSLLLLDQGLTCEQRMTILAQVMHDANT